MRLRASVGIALVILGMLGCSGAPSKPDAPHVEPPPPGAAVWSGDALALPKDSPIVVRIDLQNVMRGLSAFRGWLVEDPAMFGEGGEGTVDQINFLWGFVQAYFGSDPENPASWNQHGIDVSRPVLIGSYSGSDESLAFTDAVERTMAESLGVAPNDPNLRMRLGDAAKEALTKGAVPQGLHASVVRALTGRPPATGVRALIPATDAIALINFTEALATTLGYARFSKQELARLELGPQDRAYVHEDAGMPAFSLRAKPAMVVVDIVVPADSAGTARGSDSETERPLLLQELQWAISEVEQGRPSAPKAPSPSAVSVGFYHPGASRIARVRGYRATLAAAKSMGAAKRDPVVLSGLLQALLTARAWDLRAEDAPALTYSVGVPPGEDVTAIAFEMAMFTGHGVPELKIQPGKGGLAVSERGLGFSVSLDPFNLPAWKNWLYIERPADALDILDAGDFDSFAELATPRNLVLILGNLSRSGAESFDPGLGAIIELIPNLTRLEFATPDANLSNFSRQPKFMLYASFSGDTDAENRRNSTLMLVNMAMGALESITESPSQPLLTAAEETGSWGALDEFGANLRYHHDQDFVFITAGLSAEEAEAERKNAQTAAAASPYGGQFRLEPLAVLSALTADLDVNDFIVPSILAQRMGPIVGFVTSESKAEPHVSFRVEIQRPHAVE